MTSTSMALAGLLLLSAFASLASGAQAASACTDLLYDDSCASTLCVVPTPQTGFCTTRSVCVVGETRCIGHLACVGNVCVPDPCYTTACTASGSQAYSLAPFCFLEIVGPDLILRSCLDPANPDCLVYTERWGKEGEYMGKTCTFP
jgi:hypothetical protein